MSKSPYRITVSLDESSGKLTVDPPSLAIEPQQLWAPSVAWDFKETGVEALLADGWRPAIRFLLEGEQRFTGPFVSLCYQPTAVIGSGNGGNQGTYRYQAILEPPPGDSAEAIKSDPANLDNQVKDSLATTRITVRFVSENEPLTVKPLDVAFFDGQAVLWQVEGVPAETGEWYPRIVFQEPENTNPYFGPFTSLTASADDNTLVGMGNDQIAVSYNYVFQLVSVADGEVLFASTVDPTLDNQGDPSGGGDTTDRDRLQRPPTRS